MSTIQIQVSDDVIAHYGLEAVQEKIQKQMYWEELRLKPLKVKASLEAHGLDHEKLAKEAKKRA